MGFLSSITNQNSTCPGGEVAQLHTVVEIKAFNPSSSNSEQHQFSLNNIQVKMITKVKMP